MKKKYSIQNEPSRHATGFNNSINQRGFTLIELIMVMAIVGILSTLAFVNISSLKDYTRNARAVAEIRGLEKDILSYATENSSYPPDNNLAAIGKGGMLDPWGNPYVYRTNLVRTWTGVPINSDFDLYSYGPSRTSSNASIVGLGNKDDIIRGSDGSFVGIASEFVGP